MNINHLLRLFCKEFYKIFNYLISNTCTIVLLLYKWIGISKNLSKNKNPLYTYISRFETEIGHFRLFLGTILNYQAVD